MLSYCKLFHSNALPMTKNALEIKHRKFRLTFLNEWFLKKRKSAGQQQNTHWKQAQKPFCCVDDDACLETCPRHRVSSSAKVHTHTHIYTLMSAWCGSQWRRPPFFYGTMTKSKGQVETGPLHSSAMPTCVWQCYVFISLKKRQA